MNEIRRITITGSNWNDIIALPCVMYINKEHYYSAGIVRIRIYTALYWDSLLTSRVGCCAYIGYTLVEYENGKWGIIEKI